MYKRNNSYMCANFVYFIIIAMFIAIRIFSNLVAFPSGVGIVLNIVIQVGLMFALSVFLFGFLTKQKTKKLLKDYGFVKINFKSILLSFALGVFVYILTIFIATFFTFIINLLGYDPVQSGDVMTSYPISLLLLNLFLSAVLPGICEEVAHRGMLLQNYKRLGAKKAIMFSGLLFGLMHLNINQFFYATLIGVYLGFLTLTTGSIFPAMIIHFTNNAISTLMAYGAVNKFAYANFLNKFLENISQSGALVAMSGIFLLIILCIVSLLGLSFLLFKQTRMKQLESFARNIYKQKMRNDLMKDVENAGVVEVSNGEENAPVIAEGSIGGQKFVSIKLDQNLFKINSIYKASLKENVLLYVNIFLGVAITISTFLWGVI